MLDHDALILALQSLPIVSLKGTAYRSILNKYVSSPQYDNSPLSTKSSQTVGGRYNPPNQFGALYAADTPGNALVETLAMLKTNEGFIGIKSSPRLVLSLEYQLSQVLDLFENTNQCVIGTDLDELKQSWRDVNVEGRVAATQNLGMAIYDMGRIEALKVPSAKIAGAYNLVVFPDRLTEDSFVSVYDEDRLITAKIP
jgi:RES domain-containing protein